LKTELFQNKNKMHIKIRFVERWSSFDGQVNYYLIQKKTFFGWKYIKWIDSVAYCYVNDKKFDLLQEVLDKHFKVCNKLVKITEYPSLRVF